MRTHARTRTRTHAHPPKTSTRSRRPRPRRPPRSYDIVFDGDGSCSLWDYSLGVSNIKSTGASGVVHSGSAKQLLGFYDSSDSALGGDAVYFAAHDPAHVVKTCSASGAQGSLGCTAAARVL